MRATLDGPGDDVPGGPGGLHLDAVAAGPTLLTGRWRDPVAHLLGISHSVLVQVLVGGLAPHGLAVRWVSCLLIGLEGGLHHRGLVGGWMVDRRGLTALRRGAVLTKV